MTNIEDSVKWYMARFPESQFLVDSRYKKEHSRCTILGHQEAQQSNVLICGITRNSGKVLPYTIARIEKLARYFNKHHIFIYENDSTDNTKDQLFEWSKSNDNVTIKTETLNPPDFSNNLKGLQRRHYMARARNVYLSFAQKYVTENKTHYVIIVDTDLDGGWSYIGVLNSLGQSNWDVIGSNSLYYFEEDGKLIRLFYDSWAFRSYDCPEEIEDKEANLFKFNRGEPLIRVNSCFGGLGIYKPHTLFKGVCYTEEDCDHATFNNQLAKKGCDIFLNPSQITLYNKTEYT